MIKEFQKYGFKHQEAFHSASNISLTTFDAIVKNESWWIQKQVLRHKECPLSIRDTFVKDPVWYKRFVAFYAKSAPLSYRNMAMKDPDKRVRDVRIGEAQFQIHKILNPLGVNKWLAKKKQ